MRLNNFHYGLLAVLLVALLGVSGLDFNEITGNQVAQFQDLLLECGFKFEIWGGYHLSYADASRFSDMEQIKSYTCSAALGDAESKCAELTNCEKSCPSTFEVTREDFDERGTTCRVYGICRCGGRIIQAESPMIGECPIIIEGSVGCKELLQKIKNKEALIEDVKRAIEYDKKEFGRPSRLNLDDLEQATKALETFKERYKQECSD